MAYAVLTSTESGAQSLTDINANFALAAPLASPTFTGTVTTPAIKITTGATNGYLLQSDASGNGSWVANSGAITIETGTSATQSLTTTAGQKVIVWVKGYVESAFTSGTVTVTLSYNSISKDTVDVSTPAGNAATGKIPFALMYTETPGAATHNITVTSSNTLGNINIIVLKIG